MSIDFADDDDNEDDDHDYDGGGDGDDSFSVLSLMTDVGLLQGSSVLQLYSTYKVQWHGSGQNLVDGERSCLSRAGLQSVSGPPLQEGMQDNIGALIITSTVVGVPYYSYSIMGPQTLF